jgi:hypothetical protein
MWVQITLVALVAVFFIGRLTFVMVKRPGKIGEKN